MSRIILSECPGISDKAYMDLKVEIETIKDFCPRADYQRVKKILPSLLRRIVAHDVKYIGVCPLLDWIVVEAGIALPKQVFWHCNCGIKGAPPQTVDVDSWVKSQKPVISVSRFIEQEHCPISVEYDIYEQADASSLDDDQSDGEEYLAQMEDLPSSELKYIAPLSNENHISQTRNGEILVGGMPRRKQQRPKGRSNRSRNYERGNNFSDTRHTKVRMYSQIVPDEIITKVTYTERGKLTNAGSGYASKRWTPNAPYDVDPVAGSTATIGHSEMSALYGFCTALEASGFVNVANAENGPLGVYLIWTNNDPGTSSSYAVQAANPHGRMYQLAGASAGGSRTKIPIRKKFSEIVGTKLIETADSYRSTVTSTPADLIWMGLGCETYVPYVLTILGLEYELKLDMLVRYSGRKTLTA